MSMQELPDDQLDGLFKKSLEESEPPYDPAAWPGMEEKLTSYDRQQFWKRWLRRVLPAAVLLVLPVSLWLLTRDRSSADPVDQTRSARLVAGNAADHSVVRPVKPSASEVGGSVTVETGSAGSVIHKRDQSADQQTTDAAVSVKISQPQPSVLVMKPVDRVNKKATEGTSVEGAILSERTEVVAPMTPARTSGMTARMARTKRTRTIEPSGADLVAVETVLPKSSGLGVERTVSDDADNGSNQQPVVVIADERVTDRFLIPIEPLQGRFPTVVSQVSALSRALVAPVAVADAQPAQLPAVSRERTTGLSVRAMVSPDLSSVGLTNFSRPGTNVGLLLEYQLQRWHVQAGVLRSVKVYQAAESAYEYSAVRQWPVVPSSIDGRCNMLDIPINLRYDVALISRQRALPPSRWFVSAGATTYYMLREDYTYKYDNPADPKIKYRDWTTETGRYGFSQLNLSIGYERAVTQRLFWQVEPFLKVPLKGVGYYKINLLSTGAFFSLRYRL